MKPDAYTRLYLWLMAHRGRVLAVVVLFAAISLLITRRVVVEEDMLNDLPKNDQMVDEYRYTIRKFRQIDRVYFDVGLNTDDPDKLALAVEALRTGLAANPAFLPMMHGFEGDAQHKVVDLLTGSLPNLFTEADARALAPKLQPDAIRDFLTVMRRKLSGPEGMVLKEVVAADPVGMSSLVVAKALTLQSGIGEAHIEEGRITSNDGRHVMVMAEPKFPSSDGKASAALVKEMLRLTGEIETRFPGVHVAITGGHRMAVDNARLIATDAERCVGLGMAAMLVLCLTAYRRRWLALVTFLPSLFGTLLAGMVLALCQPHLSAMALGLASIAIGITVDYAIYVIYHLDNAAGLDREAVGRQVGRLVLPVSVGALTTIAAFLVMLTSPMGGYQQLGIYGALGVLFSAFFALVVLPLLVPIPRQSGQPPLWLTRLMDRFSGWRDRRMGWCVAGLVVLSVVTAIGARRLHFEGDIARLNGITEPTRRDEALIRQIWGDALNMTIVVARGATLDEALAQNDRAAEVLAAAPGLSAVYSLNSVVPSLATQDENLRRWRAFWTADRRQTLHQSLDQIAGQLGFQPDAFAGFWQRLDGERPKLTIESFRGTPIEQALNERVAQAPGDVAVSTILKIEDHSQAEPLRRALAGMILVDKKAFAQHVADLARDGLGKFALWTSLLVAAIVYFSLTSIELVLATLLPLAFGLLWTFGIMGWLGLPIDIVNSVFVIFIIGVGEDYSVFLVTSKLDEWRGQPPRLAATSASVLISALTTIFGFAVLVFAKHPVLFSMGTTVLLGMVCSIFATLILTPLCMDLLLFRDPPRGAPRWWHLIGTVWVSLHLGGSELFLYYVLRPILKVVSPLTADERLRRATRWMARGVVKAMPFGKLQFQNITSETFTDPSIIISNHQSAVDVMLVVSLPGDIRQTAKKRIFDTPSLGIGCQLLGHVLVEPNDPETTLRRCRERLSEGASVHFYPEGTRSPDGFLQRFHRGAFELAVELRKDILPIILCDTVTAMPRDAYWFEPYHVTVTALPRITPQTFDYSSGSLALMRHCEQVVRAGFQQQLDRINTPEIVRRKVERLYRYQGKFVEQFAHWKMKLDPVFPALDGVVPRQGFVLDLGCGYGLATHWLAQFTDERAFLGADYDADKIRVAQRSAPQHRRIHFEVRDILEWDYPACDTVLLLDVLHYWTPEKQQLILNRIRQALNPGGRLVLRDAARDETARHRRVHRWERFATRIGHNQTREGLHFQTRASLTAAITNAGFARWEIRSESAEDSNILLVAS